MKKDENEDIQRWNEDKCRCECKELIHKGVCDKGYVFGIHVIVSVMW